MRTLRLLPLLALALVGSLRAAEALPKADFVPAFNGKDLTGWKTASAEAFWTVADGVLSGENKESFKDYKKGSMLYTEKSYQDVVIECECRFSGEIDSGIMVRKDAAGKKDIQMQIGVSRSLKKDMTCTFYVGKYPEAGWAPKVPALWKNGDWNKIRFQAKGDTYTVWLNGEQVSNYVDAGYPKAAPVGLQVHGGVKMKVEYRNIAIGEIK
ncbi:MAG: DUF1080 domain-containing protein [Verrucomicrobiota bacterium]